MRQGSEADLLLLHRPEQHRLAIVVNSIVIRSDDRHCLVSRQDLDQIRAGVLVDMDDVMSVNP